MSIGNDVTLPIHGHMALLGDYSRQGLEKPDARLIGTHARFSRAMQLLNFASTISPTPFPIPTTRATPTLSLVPRSHSNTLSTLNHLFIRLVSPLWRLLPRFVRGYAYQILARIGHWRYGKDDPNASVQRLPFGLYLKYQTCPALLMNEFNALQILRKKTNVPCPRAVDLIVNKEDDTSYLLTTRVPGVQLARVRDLLSDQDLVTISAELTDYVSQL